LNSEKRGQATFSRLAGTKKGTGYFFSSEIFRSVGLYARNKLRRQRAILPINKNYAHKGLHYTDVYEKAILSGNIWVTVEGTIFSEGLRMVEKWGN